MSELSLTLKRARTQAGLTMEQVAQYFGISRSSVSQWENVEKSARPDIAKLPALAELYGVDLGLLLQGDITPTANIPTVALPPPNLSGAAPVIAWSDDLELPDGIVIIPRYRMALSMGTGKLIFEAEQAEAGAAFRADWVRQKCKRPDSCFVSKVEGESMQPSLNDGESVLIDRAQTDIIDRKIYAVLFSGEIYCKRLFKAGDEIVLRSDNPIYPEIRAKPEDVQIVGRVVWHGGEL